MLAHQYGRAPFHYAACALSCARVSGLKPSQVTRHATAFYLDCRLTGSYPASTGGLVLRSRPVFTDDFEREVPKHRIQVLP